MTQEDFQLDTGERFSGFQNLMPFRVQEILLVASLYDSYTLEEGGRLTEVLLNEYRELNLSFAPHITRASTGDRALELVQSRRFDMVITMPRIGAMKSHELAQAIKVLRPNLPVVLLAFNPREAALLNSPDYRDHIDRVFLWSGDVRILLAIIKLTEDERNAEQDSRIGDVRILLLVEDSVRFYSSYLPMLYTALLNQTQALMDEGINFSHRLLRMRARPKIFHALDFEHAMSLYETHRHYLLGVISDSRFPRKGQRDDEAGLRLIRRIRRDDPHIPVVLQSTNPKRATAAEELNAGFLNKNSSNLLDSLRRYMQNHLGFGDFIFRLPDGTEVARADTIHALIRAIGEAPPESIHYHASHDHFSNWLRARTEFAGAASLRAQKVEDFETIEDLREGLIETLSNMREESQRGIVADFSPQLLTPGIGFYRIGGGSLGGKGRGLAFMNSILSRPDLKDRISGLKMRVPPTLVVATDTFDEVIERNNLRDIALADTSDEAIVDTFLRARFPADVLRDLDAFLSEVRYPLAIRSSGLLEDSQYQPFAGVYRTYMLPNNHPDRNIRLARLLDAIRLVYASTFFKTAKSYLRSTSNRVEEEKMAVIIQQVVGRQHQDFFYPDFSGVSHSANFYPLAGLRPEDGIAMVALGLGRTVVEGMKFLRFPPANPDNIPQFATPQDILRNSQREFFAIDTSRPNVPIQTRNDPHLKLLPLVEAEKHGTLDAVASVYSPDNNAVYEGIGREGIRVVSFAPILKSKCYPLSETLLLLQNLARQAMSCDVEMEFAGRMGQGPEEPHELGFLQIRPLTALFKTPEIEPEDFETPDALCTSSRCAGNGRIRNIRDIIYIPQKGFDRAKTQSVAEEIERINNKMLNEERPYLLIGPGRWGSADRWLGIPVEWPQISGARVIVETNLDDIKVEPSQGTHFFQNLTSFQIGYMTIHTSDRESRLDLDRLEGMPSKRESSFIRHINLEHPLEVLLDGRTGRGIIKLTDKSD